MILLHAIIMHMIDKFLVLPRRILESDYYYIVGKGLSIQDVFTRELLMVLRYIVSI